jgi:hypothetical protein
VYIRLVEYVERARKNYSHTPYWKLPCIIPKQLAREGILELLGIQNLVFHVLTLLLKESAYRLTSIVIAGLDNKNTRTKSKIPVFEGVGKRPKQKSYMK